MISSLNCKPITFPNKPTISRASKENIQTTHSYAWTSYAKKLTIVAFAQSYRFTHVHAQNSSSNSTDSESTWGEYGIPLMFSGIGAGIFCVGVCLYCCFKNCVGKERQVGKDNLNMERFLEDSESDTDDDDDSYDALSTQDEVKGPAQFVPFPLIDDEDEDLSQSQPISNELRTPQAIMIQNNQDRPFVNVVAQSASYSRKNSLTPPPQSKPSSFEDREYNLSPSSPH